MYGDSHLNEKKNTNKPVILLMWITTLKITEVIIF